SPLQPIAIIFKCAILVAGAAAIATQLLPGGLRRLRRGHTHQLPHSLLSTGGDLANVVNWRRLCLGWGFSRILNRVGASASVKGWRVCRMHGAHGGAPAGERNGNYRRGGRQVGYRAEKAYSEAFELRRSFGGWAHGDVPEVSHSSLTKQHQILCMG